MIRRMSIQGNPGPARWKQIPLAVAAAGITLVTAQAASAQLRQYSTPGELAAKNVPTRETLRERMAEARWQAGSWRLQPRFSIGNLVYSNNVFDSGDGSEQVSDLRASAAAGIDAYAPLGDDAVFAAFVRPNYSWWQENEDQRRFNMSYGAALFGLFNRLSTELSARRSEAERVINNELRIPTVVRQDRAALDTRVKIRGPWQLFGSVAINQTRYPNASAIADRAPSVGLLARDEDVFSAGVAYDVPGRFNVDVGWRRVDARFVVDPQLRSNSGQYPFLRVGVTGNKIEIDGSIGLRLLEFESQSSLVETEEAIGTLRTSIDVGTRTSFTVFGGRDIVYSAVNVGGFFASQRAGVALGWGTGLRASLFAETSRDEFQSADGAAAGRIDDGESYGIRFFVPLKWGLVMNLGVAETQVDSTFDEFDRSLTAITSSVSLDLPDLPF